MFPLLSPSPPPSLSVLLQLLSLQSKLNAIQLEYLELQVQNEEQVLSLKQQVQVMQKVLIKITVEYFI